VKKKRPES
jgi:hypothetical protein